MELYQAYSVTWGVVKSVSLKESEVENRENASDMNHEKAMKSELEDSEKLMHILMLDRKYN